MCSFKQHKNSAPNAFHWREVPAQIDWRQQTYRAARLDPRRVNPPSYICRDYIPNSVKAPR